MFVNHLQWRKDVNIDETVKRDLSKAWCNLDEVKEAYPTGWAGVDHEHRPIYCEKLGQLDVDMLMKFTTLDDAVRNSRSRCTKHFHEGRAPGTFTVSALHSATDRSPA